MWAALEGPINAEALSSALAAGADATAYNAAGYTAVHALSMVDPVPGTFAHERPSGALRRMLQIKGVDENARCRGRSGATALHLAAALSRPRDTMTVLLAHGADVHALDFNGATPLYAAVTASSVSMLLAHGADPTCRDLDDSTVLHRLAHRLAPAALAELLQHPAVAALVDARDACGITPLHILAARVTPPAMWPAVVDMAAALLQHGADVSAEDSDGKTPIASTMVDFEQAASAHPSSTLQDGRLVWTFRYTLTAGDITPAQQAAALRHRLQLLRLLWWHRRRPALAGFARLRSAGAASAAPTAAAASGTAASASTTAAP